MQLAEQHVIGKTDPHFAAINAAAFASKNLYHAANYMVRQCFIPESAYLTNAEVFHRIKDHEAYSARPRKVSTAVLRQLARNWRGFFAALAAWQESLRATSAARAVSLGNWAAAECPREWLVQHPPKSTPRRFRQRESGCGSSPRMAPRRHEARGVMVAYFATV